MKSPHAFKSLLSLISLGAALTLGAFSASAQPVRYQAIPGSKVKIEGTSTIHDWSVESGIIGGYIEFQADNPLDPSKATVDLTVIPKVAVSIPVRSIKSGKKLMDDIMHDTLKVKDNSTIKYTLKEMKARDHKAGTPFEFDTKGELTVAGVTKPIDMVVTMTPLDGNKIKSTGSKDLKMSDFGMKAPAPAIGLGLIKTSDDVKVTFEWLTARKDEKKSASNN
jgi:polyisoprenoid-binding protein YceI